MPQPTSSVILVTGMTGFTGSHLVLSLVRVLVRSAARARLAPPTVKRATVISIPSTR